MKVEKYYATWCGPCKAVGQMLEEIVAGRDDINYKEIDIESDEGVVLSEEHRIMSVPTVIVYDNDNNIKTVMKGAKTRKDYEAALAAN